VLVLLLLQYVTATPLELVAQLALQCEELYRWGQRVRVISAVAVALTVLGALLRPDPAIAAAAIVWWAAGPSVATVGGGGRIRTGAVLLLASMANDVVWARFEMEHPLRCCAHGSPGLRPVLPGAAPMCSPVLHAQTARVRLRL
jgi:hypothetical protein